MLAAAAAVAVAAVPKPLQKQLRKTLGGGENASQQLRQQVDKRMGHMEKRLNRAIQRHNEVESKHSALKARINRMRRDKLMYREVYKKLEVKLEVKQKQMAVMIDRSNEVFHRREKTIKMIIDHMAKNKFQFEGELAICLL